MLAGEVDLARDAVAIGINAGLEDTPLKSTLSAGSDSSCYRSLMRLFLQLTGDHDGDFRLEDALQAEKPQIERKDKVEKEDDQGKETEEVKDDRADMGIEVEEPEEVKVTDEVIDKKKGRKRREERDEMLKEFVQGLRAKSQRTTNKPKFLESPFQTVIPKKRSKGKKAVIVVKDDED
ncbi:uncharacterized protein A4U43_C01F22350 [Asparagus officinalis]|uniref:Uncharacterized protein n=1 Tax=Asparagus officinalis TaxID=4686 RepID=A0A5P1FRI7_ASPOF|nr:uncharacterized protein A4U43_C01F22350 [Asparagus officinalis]